MKKANLEDAHWMKDEYWVKFWTKNELNFTEQRREVVKVVGKDKHDQVEKIVRAKYRGKVFDLISVTYRG